MTEFLLRTNGFSLLRTNGPTEFEGRNSLGIDYTHRH